MKLTAATEKREEKPCYNKTSNLPHFVPMNLFPQASHTRFFAMLCLLLSVWTANAQEMQIVAFGTSFTSGKGVWPIDAFPAKLENMLRAEGLDVRIKNQGVNGDSTLDLLARLEQAVPAGVQVAIFEYARGNDRRKGISRDDTVKNSEKIISRLVAREIQVLLVIRGPNQDELQERTQWFSQIIPRHGISFLALEQPESSLQSDGQHPSAAAHEAIAASMVSPVKKLIERAQSRGRISKD